jgi:hypothetical protein
MRPRYGLCETLGERRTAADHACCGWASVKVFIVDEIHPDVWWGSERASAASRFQSVYRGGGSPTLATLSLLTSFHNNSRITTPAPH